MRAVVAPAHAARYAAIAALVSRGEWTTYGDISIAVHGSPRYARHVGRAAASFGPFPNAPRVLARGGTIAAGWRGAHGEGPEACREHLEREGVAFIAGRADPARRITWEQLIGRADAASVPRAMTIVLS